MDLIYLFRHLLKKKWYIIAAGLLAAIAAYFFTQNTPKKYRSVSQISTGFTVSDKITVGNDNFDLFEAETKFNNTITTITSPSVFSLLSYQLILHDLESSKPFRSLTEKEKNSEVYKQVNLETAKKVFRDKLENMNVLTSFKPEEKKLLEFLSLYKYDYQELTKQLIVYRMQRTDYIELEAKTENPELSAFLVNEVFGQFIRYYKKTRGTISQESIDTLKSIMDKKKLELDYKNALLGGGSVNNEVQSSSTLGLVSNFETALEQEKVNLATLNASLIKTEQRLANIGVPVNTAGNNDELLILRKAMNDTYTAYVNGGSKDKDLLARYNQLKTDYQAKVAALNPTPSNEKPTESKAELLQRKKDLEIDIQTSKASIASLQEKINNLRSSVYRNAYRGASAEALAKEAEQANNEYLLAKQKYNDAIDMSASSVNNYRQVLLGQPAISPEPSKRLMLIGLAGFSGFATTLMIFVFIAYFDSSVRTPAIFAKQIKLNLISMINFMSLKNKTFAEIFTRKEDLEQSRNKSDMSVFKESFRKLRYEIEVSNKKIILFASTKKGQGKTTIIQCLAHIFSLSKKRILIIDTNFCNNDLTVQMNAPALIEQLEYHKSSGKTPTEHIFEHAKKASEGEIYIIGSEPGNYTPEEILPSENILQYLQELKNDFDYIFLEGPPLNDFSDAKELSGYAEGVVGVFSATDMIRQIDKESIRFFKDLKEKYIGSILNMVDLKDVNSA